MFNKNEFNGKWNQFKGELKKMWGKLTDDDLKQAEGNYDKLVGKIQERYGEAQDATERRVQDFYAGWCRNQPTQQTGRRSA